MQLLSKTPQLKSSVKTNSSSTCAHWAEPTFVECSCGEINCWCGDDFEDFFSYLICHCLSQKLVLMALEKSGTHKEIKVYVKSQFFLCNHYKFSEFRVDVHTLLTSDEPKLEFSGSSRAKPSRAGALLFSSWNQAEPKFF